MFIAANNFGRQSAWQVAILLVAAIPLADRLAGAIEPSVETVSLYLNVEKDRGLVTGLTQANFRLYQEGKPQQFRLEKPEEPASIALLVEHSGSSGYFADDLAAGESNPVDTGQQDRRLCVVSEPLQRVSGCDARDHAEHHDGTGWFMTCRHAATVSFRRSRLKHSGLSMINARISKF